LVLSSKQEEAFAVNGKKKRRSGREAYSGDKGALIVVPGNLLGTPEKSKGARKERGKKLTGCARVGKGLERGVESIR